MSVTQSPALAGVTSGSRREWASSREQTIPEILEAVRASVTIRGYFGTLGNTGEPIADGVDQWTEYAGQLLAAAQGYVDQQLAIPNGS